MKPRIISSVQNDEIKEVIKLRDPKERRKQKRFIVEGLRTITTFLEAGHKPSVCYVLEDMVNTLPSSMPAVVTIVNESVINRISLSTTPSGLLAIFPIPKSPSLDELGAGIVLANITDPGNMGTLIRTCAAMGKKSVVVIEGVDVWSPKVVQATAGTLAYVTVFHWTWQDLIHHKKNLSLQALVVDGGEALSKDIGNNSLFVIGNEAHGIPEEWVNQCDKRVTLSMPSSVESLNAAVAGSIAMYIAWS